MQRISEAHHLPYTSYKSWLLRLWFSDSEKHPRIVLMDVESGQQHAFPSLANMVNHLEKIENKEN